MSKKYEMLNEAGFIQRFSANPMVVTVSEFVKKLSNLGMRYEDQVVRNSKAIGATEGQFIVQGPLPENQLHALAMADIGTKKYIAYFDKDLRNKREFLRKFALNGEIEFILDTLADESIVYDMKNFFCRPDTDNLAYILKSDIRDEVIDKINDNFKRLYVYFHFNDDISAWQYFKQFLIDGFLSFEIIFNEKGDKIIGFKELDPLSLRPDVEKTESGWKKVWYQYEDQPALKRKLYDSQVIYISYAKGAYKNRVSYVERLVRSFNLLRIMENTRVIWNLMNSTYRMKMIVPIGSKSPQKARESLAELMSIYKEEINLNNDTGELSVNGKSSMQFYKNYMFPSKQGEQIDIQTIAAEGPDLSDTSPLKYFYDKLKMDSKIPASRFERDGNGGQVYMSAEGLDREEVRFFKFINRLRSIFQEILWKPLWIQSCLDNPDLADDELFRANLGINFNKDNVFEERKEQEIIQKRMEFIMSLKDYMQDDQSTPYFSSRWLIEKYLKLSPDDLKQNQMFLKNNSADQGDEQNAEKAVNSFSKI